MLSQPFVCNLNLMNPGIIILEYACAIRNEKKKNPNQYILVVNTAEPRPDPSSQAFTIGTTHDRCSSSASLLISDEHLQTGRM